MSKAGIITYNIIIYRVTINQIRTIVGDTVSCFYLSFFICKIVDHNAHFTAA